MAAPVLIRVDDKRFPSGYATLPEILANTFGVQPGQFLGCATTGWRTGAYLHVETKPLVGVASTSGGGLLGYIPAEGNPIIVAYTNIYVVTKSTGAATIDIGVATNTTTAADNLIDGADVGTNSAVCFDNITDISTNGKSRQLMTGVQALTVTGLADTTGFLGILYVCFFRATNTGL